MERTIRVTGKGKLSVKPDMIQLRLNLEETQPDYESALKMSAEFTEMLKDIFENLGFERSSLKTLYFNVDTVYENYQDRNKSWKRRFEGYKFMHRMKIEFQADNVLLGKSIEDSKMKAKVLTEAAGVNLENILTIDYSWGEIDFVTKPVNEMMLRCCEEDSCEEPSGYSMDIEADDIDVTDTVTVVWNIS